MNKYLLLLLVGLLFSCKNNKTKQEQSIEQQATPQPFLEQITYSNLVDTLSQQQAKEALFQAGVSSENIAFFLENVSYFNDLVGEVGLVKQGFSVSNDLTPNYDQAHIITRWEEKNPVFLGYNCRITSLGLMRDFISVKNPQQDAGANLFIDEDVLQNSPKEIFSDQEKQIFMNLYSNIPTPYVPDVQVHIQNVCKDWSQKGIFFKHKGDKTKASLISVFFHSAITEQESEIFAGHVGVLLPTSDSKILFIEKLSFQEPYQFVKLNNRTELNDLLMARYDVEWGQPTSIPFIFENDELLEGYRPNLKKQIANETLQ